MTRSVRWTGSCNARDLGGLQRTDGTVTASGRVFRSGRIEPITSEGWNALHGSGVRTIVDLRNGDEIGRTAHDPDIDDAVLARITRVHRPIEDQRHEEFMSRWGELLAHPSYYSATFEYFPELLRSAFEAIAEAETAVLFHCSAGKDRTGLVAAMILALNNVTMADIEADYELGVRGYAEWLHAHPGQGRERVLPDHELEAAIVDRRRALRAWISAVDVANLLATRLGLTGDQVARLSRLLVD
ncbi:MAG: tyrosine-protein phosphatase [Actinomycetota bacterium]